MSLSVPKLARPLPLHHHSSYGSLTMSFHTFTPFLGSTHKLRFISPIKLNAPRFNSSVVSVSDLFKNNKPKSTTNLVPLFFSFHINVFPFPQVIYWEEDLFICSARHGFLRIRWIKKLNFPFNSTYPISLWVNRMSAHSVKCFYTIN